MRPGPRWLYTLHHYTHSSQAHRCANTQARNHGLPEPMKTPGDSFHPDTSFSPN